LLFFKQKWRQAVTFGMIMHREKCDYRHFNRQSIWPGVEKIALRVFLVILFSQANKKYLARKPNL